MDIFHLPDLGEGLPDAEIHTWHVKVGDEIQQDQPLVSMETAKALVEVPSPQTGVIEALFGKPGEHIKTGAPLVKFKNNAQTAPSSKTVVGSLQEEQHTTTDTFTLSTSDTLPRATPAVRLLAKQAGIDWTTLEGTGEQGLITQTDVKRATPAVTLPEGSEPLQGVRRSMCQLMTAAHQVVIQATLQDEADLHAWPENTDVTLRLIRALAAACAQEPSLNAWFDGKQLARSCPKAIHVGLAMDSEAGLFVPVLRDVATQSDKALRQQIDDFKEAIKTRSLKPEQLKDATIVLSNFGTFGGRFATPVVTPPTVAILGAGRTYTRFVEGSDKQPVSHPMLPLSLSFDHRAVTGGEASRFLSHVIKALL